MFSGSRTLPSRTDHGAAADQPVWVGDLPQLLRDEAEHRAIEQHEIVHPPDRSACAMWSIRVSNRLRVTRRETGGNRPRYMLRPDGSGCHQIDQCAVGRAHRRNAALARPIAFLPFRTQQCLGARYRACRVVHAQRHGAHRRPVQLKMFRRGAVLLAVQHQVDRALGGTVDRFRAMAAGVDESRARAGISPAAGRFRRPRRIRGIPHRRTRGGAGRVVAPASASTRISERSPSRAVRRAGAARNSSLNTSSDSGPR